MNRLQQTRKQIGYFDDNIAVNYSRNPYGVLQFDRNMSGRGFTDTIKSIYDKGKSISKYISDGYSGEIGTSLRNMIPDSDENARPGFPGEKHAILRLENGKYGVANYMGPGTSILERIKRGDPPRTEVDKVAMAHDIRYSLAKTQSDIRKADNIMINKIDQISRNRLDSGQNITQARLMKAKVIGEDLGLLKKDAFSGYLSKNKNISKKDKELLENKLNELAPEGYGLLPGDRLKLKLLKQMARKRKKRQSGSGKRRRPKNKGQSRSRDLGKQYKLLGSGLNLPGTGKGNIMNFVINKILPSLLKTVGLPKDVIKNESIINMISKSLDMAKSGNMSSIISNLSKALLPILTAAKMKHMNMHGRGIVDVLKGYKKNLLEKLGLGLFKAFKWYLNKAAKDKGMKPIFGSGINLPGGKFSNFWKDFNKGFKMVFKPGAKIVGDIASAMGHPEFGIALRGVSELL